MLDVGPTLSVRGLVWAPTSDASLISDLLEYWSCASTWWPHLIDNWWKGNRNQVGNYETTGVVCRMNNISCRNYPINLDHDITWFKYHVIFCRRQFSMRDLWSISQFSILQDTLSSLICTWIVSFLLNRSIRIITPCRHLSAVIVAHCDLYFRAVILSET